MSSKKSKKAPLSLMSGFSDTALLMICHFVHGFNDADIALRAAAAQELYARGILTSSEYSVSHFKKSALKRRSEGFNDWGDELYNCITGDDDTVEGHFYRKVLGMEPPKYDK